MELFGSGFFTGLMLTIMIGPVTMVILRNGIIEGPRAGFAAASGTWMSDFVFIALTFFLTNAIHTWTEIPHNKLMVYIGGGIALVLFGAWMSRGHNNDVITQIATPAGIRSAFVSGFIVNTLSPFTLFFWLGTAVVLHMEAQSPALYYTGVMAALMAGDSIKAWIAPKLLQWIKGRHLRWVQLVAGVVIAVTGVYILYLGISAYLA